MVARDAIDGRVRVVIADTNPLAVIIKTVLDDKDRRIDDLLRSNQELRARAQLAESRLAALQSKP